MPTSTEKDLRGQTAVVTGAATGIGRAIALELAAAGAAVVIHARQSKTELQDVARLIDAAGSASCLLLADLANTAEHEALVEQAWSWRDGVDVWVNNAGADVLTGAPAQLSFDEKLELLWQVDVRGTLRLARLAGQRMKARGRGVILNVGWDQAWQGMAGDSGELFAASKGAIMAFSKSLAQSLAPEVRVNCLAPGWIRTAWGQVASDAWQRRAVGESLVGRWGLPEDVAHLARFLASPRAAFINGQIVDVNGGFRRA